MIRIQYSSRCVVLGENNPAPHIYGIKKVQIVKVNGRQIPIVHH